MAKGTDQHLAPQQDFGTEDILQNVDLGQQESAADAALLETSINSPKRRPNQAHAATCEKQAAKRMSSTPVFEGLKLETELKQVSSTKRLSAAKVSKTVNVRAPRSATSVFDKLVTWLATQIRLLVEKFLLLLGKQEKQLPKNSPAVHLEDPNCEAVLIELQTRRKRKIRRPLTHHLS